MCRETLVPVGNPADSRGPLIVDGAPFLVESDYRIVINIYVMGNIGALRSRVTPRGVIDTSYEDNSKPAAPVARSTTELP